MLERFREGVWVEARPQTFWGIETGTRMTIVRLSDGGLFVHCPVALDRAMRDAVDALGPVRTLVAASLYHHLYIGEWMAAYPRATAWACPDLSAKRPDLRFTGVLGDTAHEAWATDLDQAPMTARFEREVVFFHRASRTMICADSLLNLSTHPSRRTRFVAQLMGNTGPGKGYLERIAVRDYRLGREQVDRVLQWDIDGVVLAHGALLPHGGHRAVRDAYAFLPSR